MPISRDSSAVEQLIRNQQVVGSIPILGSDCNPQAVLILARPIQSTLLAFMGFVAISMVLIGISLVRIINHQAPWYAYLTIIVLGPVSLYLLYKMAYNYKTVEFDARKITVRYPLKKVTKSFSSGQLLSWGEVVVKTGKTSTFKELELRFADRTSITLAHGEYSNYGPVVAYLKKYAGSKEQAPET